MLYDAKRWEKTPFSFDHLLPWLEQQPKQQPYDPSDIYGCLLGQYAEAHGFRPVGAIKEVVPHLSNTIYGGRRTFGAALRRAQYDHLGVWEYCKLRFRELTNSN